MGGRKTKGKQKIDIKKVQKNVDRLVTFTKRKTGIYTKLSEISILCGADVGFLTYSCAGKPFIFGNPSFDVVAQRFLHGNHHYSGIINGEGDSSLSSLSMIVDAHKKVKVDEFCKKINNIMEETDAVKNGTSWKVDPKDEEQAKQLLRRYEEYYEALCQVAAARSRGRYAASASSSSFPLHG